MAFCSFSAYCHIRCYCTIIFLREGYLFSTATPIYIAWAYETGRQGIDISTPLGQKELLLASDVGIKYPEKLG